MTDKQWDKIKADVMGAAYNVNKLAMAFYDATWGKTLKTRNKARRFVVGIAKKNGWRE